MWGGLKGQRLAVEDLLDHSMDLNDRPRFGYGPGLILAGLMDQERGALIEDSARGENVRVHIDHLEVMLDGYESVRPLNDAEAAALAPMTALCHAEFALSEADYFLGVLHSKEKARLASIDYLVGHARWFRGMGGQKLLDAIQRWAGMRER